MDLDPLEDVLHQLATYAMEGRDYEVNPNTLGGKLTKRIRQIK